MSENAELRRGWAEGDIIQIDPKHDDVFGGCLSIVREPKSWGAMVYVRVPGFEEQGGTAFYRLPFEGGKKVGRAEWLLP